jgi:glucose/mannose-6-phosphate isomerase
MLDDLKYIHEKDREDALGIAERQCAQLTFDFDLSQVNFDEILNVVWTGMGGSALPGEIIKTWLTLSVPFEIVRDYNLPFYVGEKTLVIVASYSGNTEEAIEALAQAEAKGAQIAVMSSGGRLQELAAEKNHPFMLIPKAEQPRYAVFAMLRAGLDTLGKAEVVRTEDVPGQLASAGNFVSEASKAWRPEVPTADNPAKQLAQELMGRSVVVYGGPKMFAAAYKWKISCNENAKQVAWYGHFPEFNHNELLGWSEQPRDKPYAVVDLRSNLEHPRTQKRFVVSERLLSGRRPAAHVVEVQGSTHLEQLLWAITFGDFVTLYLGILNGLDPAPVELVEKFKKELDS